MLTPEQIADGWIAHDGGECPVAPETLVEVMCRGDDTDVDIADAWWWGRDEKPFDYDIIAYRLEPKP